MKKNRKNRGGMLAFEWILVCALLVIGVVGGIAVARNVILNEIEDTITVVDRIDADFVKPVAP